MEELRAGGLQSPGEGSRTLGATARGSPAAPQACIRLALYESLNSPQEKAKHPRGKVSLIPHTTQQPPSQSDPQGLLAASLSTHSHQNAKHSLLPTHTPTHMMPSLCLNLCSHMPFWENTRSHPEAMGRWVSKGGALTEDMLGARSLSHIVQYRKPGQTCA